MAQNPSVANQELQDQAQALGRKLGFFINSLSVSDEVKQAWMAVLGSLSLQQLFELTETLETKFLHEQTRPADETLRRTLEDILKSYGQSDSGL